MPRKRVKFGTKKNPPVKEDDIIIKEEYPSPFEQIDPEIPGCSYQEASSSKKPHPGYEEDSEVVVKEEYPSSVCQVDPAASVFRYQEAPSHDLQQRYEYLVRHKINNRKSNLKLLLIATVTEYKELELRWDFDGEYHREMQSYAIFYNRKIDQMKKNLESNKGAERDLKIHKTGFRLLGIVKALPLPMKVKITFDQHPFWCGEIFFTVRYQDAVGELGPYSKPVKCIFQPSASNFNVVRTVSSMIDFSGPDPLTDADGFPFPLL